MKPMTKEQFVEVASRLAESVYDFHVRFDASGIHEEDEEAIMGHVRNRVPILVEEVGEHCKAVNHNNLIEAAKEAADVAYVALGTLLTLGQYGGRYGHFVVEKNNKKTPETHHIGEAGKAIASG